MEKKGTPKLVGYARVSTGGQDLRLQIDALKSAGVAKADLFTDKVSGSKTARPGLDRCLQSLQPGDTLLVWRLDRLGRSLRHLVDLVEDLRQRGIGFKSICDAHVKRHQPDILTEFGTARTKGDGCSIG
jgi:DNA invertase Pin-like site-specific DNA recombinase